MRISPFVSGIATGAMAGAVVSMVTAGAMLNPSMRRNAKHAAHKAEHAQGGRPGGGFHRVKRFAISGREISHAAACGERAPSGAGTKRVDTYGFYPL